MTSPTAKATGWLGATARRPIATPKATAAQLTTETLTSVRRAESSAPTSEPTLTTDISSVNVRSLPARSRVVKSGRTTWKLKASIPMTAIMMSGTHSSGMLRAYRMPSRTWPRPRGVTGDRRILLGSISQSATRTAM